MRFFDTHCHLDFGYLSENLPETLGQLESHHIEKVLIPAVGKRNWSAVVDIANRYNGVCYALGLHPYFIGEHEAESVSFLAEQIEQALSEPKTNLVALGEVGIDKICPDLDKQLMLLRGQLEIAERFRLPIILHVRKAHDLVLPLIKQYKLNGGVLHAFSGSSDLLMAYYKLGFKVGVGPVITWPNSNKTRLAVANAPLDSIVLETDSPDMYIDGGKRGCGHPKDIFAVFEVLADIRSETSDFLADMLFKNANDLFFNRE